MFMMQCECLCRYKIHCKKSVANNFRTATTYGDWRSTTYWADCIRVKEPEFMVFDFYRSTETKRNLCTSFSITSDLFLIRLPYSIWQRWPILKTEQTVINWRFKHMNHLVKICGDLAHQPMYIPSFHSHRKSEHFFGSSNLHRVWCLAALVAS